MSINYFKLNLQYLSTSHLVMASKMYSFDVALGNNHAIKACDSLINISK